MTRRDRRAWFVPFAKVLTAAAVCTAIVIAVALVWSTATPASTPTWQLPHYTRVGYDRSFKTDLVDELPEPPQLVVLGGSRCTRFEPAYVTSLTGLPAMNLALSNFRPEDAWAILCHLYARSPDTKVRVFWGVTANGLTDITFAPGLVYDERLSQAFPAELLAQQAKLLGTVPVRDLLLKDRYSARGLLRWSTYDAQRAHGLTLDESLDRWIARYVTDKRWATRPSSRAKGYFEKTLALLNEHGVSPCIVLMPYHPRALGALRRTSWRQRQDECKAYLRGLQLTYQFRLLNYTNVSAFGGRTRCFFDGAHITMENSRILMAHAVKAAPECFK